jgi:hypothetical protein
MQSGLLTIGETNANYGGKFYSSGAWSGKYAAGLLLECLDNTEMVVHDYKTWPDHGDGYCIVGRRRI